MKRERGLPAICGLSCRALWYWKSTFALLTPLSLPLPPPGRVSACGCGSPPGLPRPVLCAALCQFFGFVRSLNAGIVLFNGMYLVVDENTRFLCGAGIAGYCGAYSSYRAFPVPQSVGGSCLSRWLRQGALPYKFLFFGDSRLCRVQTVGCFVRFSDIPFKLRRCPVPRR